MTDFYVVRTRSALIPVDEASEEILRRLPMGETLTVKVIREHHGKDRAFFWLLCHKIAKMLNAMGNDLATREYVADRIRVGTGNCDVVPLSAPMARATGHTLAVMPRSIRFDRMDDEEFRRFLNTAIAYVLTHLLPHVPTRELRAEVEEMLTKHNR